MGLKDLYDLYVTAASNTLVAQNPEKEKGRESKKSQNAESPREDKAGPTGIVKVTSAPEGADIYVDGSFYGNAPAQLRLLPGKHAIKITSADHKEWSREVEVSAGSDVNLKATLVKN